VRAKIVLNFYKQKFSLLLIFFALKKSFFLWKNYSVGQKMSYRILLSTSFIFSNKGNFPWSPKNFYVAFILAHTVCSFSAPHTKNLDLNRAFSVSSNLGNGDGGDCLEPNENITNYEQNCQKCNVIIGNETNERKFELKLLEIVYIY
jgi:hypothetical protein